MPRTILSLSLQETGSVSVLWTTHHPRGLSSKDTFMARFCDEQAGLIGDVDKSQAQKCGPPPSAQI
jgi:4a-hydroxytetrahydrobiopterin dehydratase